MSLQLLIVGHIVKDVRPHGWTPGGGALYAAAQAARLNIETAVVTACSRDIRPAALVPAVEWCVRYLDDAIEFENTYSDGARTQRVLSQADPIRLADIPEQCRAAPLVLLTPVMHDVDTALPSALAGQDRILGLGAQGWLRRLDGDRVIPGSVEEDPPWLRGDAVFLSEEDVTDADGVAAWRRRVPVVVLTRGGAGYTVWDAAGRHDIAPVPACEKDPTGAGDVFATAYLVRYHESGDTLAAARFAAAAAAVSVEGAGIEAVADRAQIEARLRMAEGH
jgi:sugar/nucleoside kinase (ribokinase family)